MIGRAPVIAVKDGIVPRGGWRENRHGEEAGRTLVAHSLRLAANQMLCTGGACSRAACALDPGASHHIETGASHHLDPGASHHILNMKALIIPSSFL